MLGTAGGFSGNFPLDWPDRWPAVTSTVRRVLLRRGAPSALVDDAIQMAAERALRRREPFDGIQGWTAWTIKVAWHEVQHEWRRQSRLEAGEPPDRPDAADPATVTDHRLELEAVAMALSELKPGDRTAALAGLDPNEAAAEPLSPSEKMRRYRARRRLAALIAQQEQRRSAPLGRTHYRIR
jgi:DNA-directed RNA polymerase specialized sigma24 family protein